MEDNLNSEVAELDSNITNESDSSTTDAEESTGSDSTVVEEGSDQPTDTQQPVPEEEKAQISTQTPEEEKEQQRYNSRLGIKNKILEGYVEADDPTEYMRQIYADTKKYPTAIADEVLLKASRGKFSNLEELNVYEQSTEEQQAAADAYMENPIVANKLKGLSDFNKTKESDLINQFAESKGLDSSEIEDLGSKPTFKTVRNALKGDGELEALEAAFNSVNPGYVAKAAAKEESETNKSRDAASSTAPSGGFQTEASGDEEAIARRIFSNPPTNY